MNDLAVQIVAPIGRDAAMLAGSLQKASLAVDVVSAFGEMSEEARDACGPLLIAEEALTPFLIGQLTKLLRSQPFWSDLPILIMTSSGRESQQALERQRQRIPLGHLTLLERPLRPATLISAVAAAVRARQRQYQVRDATPTQQINGSVESE